MDEVKDFEKDCIANPDRPLPRGLCLWEMLSPRLLRSGLYDHIGGVGFLYLAPS